MLRLWFKITVMLTFRLMLITILMMGRVNPDCSNAAVSWLSHSQQGGPKCVESPPTSCGRPHKRYRTVFGGPFYAKPPIILIAVFQKSSVWCVTHAWSAVLGKPCCSHFFLFFLSLRASRFCPQWPTLTQTPGGAVLRGRIPRPTAAKETDHSKGIYVLLLCSPLSALKKAP